MTDAEIAELKRRENAAGEALLEISKARESAERESRDERLGSIKDLVVKAHGLLCGWNHTDGCGWGYEVNHKTNEHNWRGYAHDRWLSHYERLFADTPRYGEPVTPQAVEALIDAFAVVLKTTPNAKWLLTHGLEPR